MANSPLRKPWALRLSEALPLSPAALGVAIMLAFLALRTGFLAIFGDPERSPVLIAAFWRHPTWPVVILNAALIGYMTAMMIVGLRGARRDLADLRPLLDCSDAQHRRLLDEVTKIDWRRRSLTAAVAAAVGGLVPIFDPGIRHQFGTLSLLDPLMLFVIGRHMLFGWLIGENLAIDTEVTRLFSRIGALTRIDLLDPSPLAPFAHRGLRTALLWVIAMILFSLFWIGPSPATINAGLMVLLIAITTAFFTLPVRGVQQRIRETKRAELASLRARIRSDLDALQASKGERARAAAQRLPALLASEGRIQGVREWPIDLSTLLRFALYISIGLSSWVGGALVERLLAAALD